MRNEVNREAALRHFHRGIVLEQANRVKEAADEYRRALELDQSLREAHDALGSYYHRNGLLAKAAEELRAVADLGGDFLAYFNLGYVLVELGRYEQAIESFQHCLRLRPRDAVTNYEIAYIYYVQGRYEEALRALAQSQQPLDDDWEALNLRGVCLLGLKRYDEALHALSRALLITGDLHAQVAIIERINAIERHREFHSLRSTKDQLYADEGVICIGSAHDDGITVNEVQDYHFTYPDVGTTLQRFLALVRSCELSFSAVVALDIQARPLASAIAELLGIELTELAASGEAPLLVMAVAREAELLALTVERAPSGAISLALGLNWLRHSKLLPEIVGIVARGACSTPWEAELRRLRSEGAPTAAVERCIALAVARVLAAVRETPLDTNLPRQVRYYTRQHRRLSYPLLLSPSARAAFQSG
jgi:tetratricopeptide (TPR) repeat protein